MNKGKEDLNTSTAAEYTFFVSAHETFSSIDHMLGHKTNLNKFKMIGINQKMSSDYNVVKLEIINRKKLGKTPNILKLNNALLNTHGQMKK